VSIWDSCVLYSGEKGLGNMTGLGLGYHVRDEAGCGYHVKETQVIRINISTGNYCM